MLITRSHDHISSQLVLMYMRLHFHHHKCMLFNMASISISKVRSSSKVGMNVQLSSSSNSLYFSPDAPKTGSLPCNIPLYLPSTVASGVRTIFLTSLAEAVNMLALSEIILVGSPCWLANRQNACKKELAVKSTVSSR